MEFRAGLQLFIRAIEGDYYNVVDFRLQDLYTR